MVKLIKQFEKVIHLLAPLNMGYLFNSIKEGYTNVDIYVNNEQNPTAALIIEESTFFFCGDDQDDQSLHDIIDFFKGYIKEQKDDLGWIKIIYTTDRWREMLSKRLGKLQPVTYERVLFKHDLNEIPKIVTAYDDINFVPISDTILNKEFENKELLIKEIKRIWGTVDTYLKDGIGYCAMKNDEIISWCTTRYKSQHTCGIGVRTISKYQRKGIATVLCNHVIHKCKEQNLETYWDSWRTNSPSVSIAKKNGFKEAFTYEAFLIKY